MCNDTGHLPEDCFLININVREAYLVKRPWERAKWDHKVKEYRQGSTAEAEALN